MPNLTDNKPFNRIFFVDYENTDVDGLRGISSLTEKDCVRIYYSEKHNRLTFGAHRRITASLATFWYVLNHFEIKNAIDVKILNDVLYAHYYYKDAELVIVSKDADFDKDIARLQKQGITITKRETVSTQTPLQIMPDQNNKPVSDSEPKNDNTLHGIHAQKAETIDFIQVEAKIRSKYKTMYKKNQSEDIIRLLLLRAKKEISKDYLIIDLQNYISKDQISSFLGNFKEFVDD